MRQFDRNFIDLGHAVDHLLAAEREEQLQAPAVPTDGEVAAVHVSHDFGQTWQEASLEAPANRFAWQHFSASIELPQAGYYEIWARATDTQGRTQPVTTPGWNPRGYGNNMVHRIAVLAS